MWKPMYLCAYVVQIALSRPAHISRVMKALLRQKFYLNCMLCNQFKNLIDVKCQS